MVGAPSGHIRQCLLVGPNLRSLRCTQEKRPRERGIDIMYRSVFGCAFACSHPHRFSSSNSMIPMWFQYDSNLCNVFCTLLQYLRYLLLWWTVVSAWLGRLTGTKLRYPSFTWTPPEPLLIIWKMKKSDLIISTFSDISIGAIVSIVSLTFP